ncbi:hypothetical protein [Thomasclavelia sp.]|uniref:hypothetical protein n=1 Tax=Thomasclavelia sp. TaxID=3025757 RepID=UPI0025EEDAD3|nr:hypothetical protein [Thomasclavelia sp.]
MDFYEWNKALSIELILIIAAFGSEKSQNLIITKEKKMIKRGTSGGTFVQNSLY